MSEGKSPRGDIGDGLANCVSKCRRAQRKEECFERAHGKPWNQALLDWFGEQCKERPDLDWIASMIYAEGRAGLANELLPGVERYLGRYVFDEFSVTLPPAPRRPVLVIDNSEGSGGQAASSKGKRAATGQPPGNAA